MTDNPIERAYGLLWIAPATDPRIIKARHELLKLLDIEARKRGTIYATEWFDARRELNRRSPPGMEEASD